MTGSSIQTRLWLTYILIIFLVLIIAFAGIVIAFRHSPLLYRQIFYRISLVTSFLQERLTLLPQSGWKLALELFLEELGYEDINLAILGSDSGVFLETNSMPNFNYHDLMNLKEFASDNDHEIHIYRDRNKIDWFYQIVGLPDNYFLLTTAPRPHISIRNLFQDELMTPLFRAGIFTTIIALVLGWFMATWITRPLKKISTAAEQIAGGEFIQAPQEGPLEIQQLAATMNHMNQKIKNMLESQRDFVANVTHEFKTPLTSIQGFAQAIYDETVNTRVKRKNAAMIILEETARLNRLVDDLLILAKMDSGIIHLEFSPIAINQLIDHLLEKFQIQLDSINMSVERKFFLEKHVWGDGEQLSRLFSNLISNAIKYSGVNSHLLLTTKVIDENAIIEVTDTGVGITRQDQKRIFERFYQSDKSRKGGSGRGVGLGLAIAYEIAAAHGGFISVKSEVNKGTTFMVKLPLNHGENKD